jgi:hypothetical protein
LPNLYSFFYKMWSQQIKNRYLSGLFDYWQG